LERLLLNFKIFLNFENIVFQGKYWANKFWKNTAQLKPSESEKGIILSHRFYFLIVQAFLFFEEILC